MSRQETLKILAVVGRRSKLNITPMGGQASRVLFVCLVLSYISLGQNFYQYPHRPQTFQPPSLSSANLAQILFVSLTSAPEFDTAPVIELKISFSRLRLWRLGPGPPWSFLFHCSPMLVVPYMAARAANPTKPEQLRHFQTLGSWSISRDFTER